MNSSSVEILLSGEEYDKEKVEKALKRAKFVVADSAKMSALPL